MIGSAIMLTFRMVSSAFAAGYHGRVLCFLGRAGADSMQLQQLFGAEAAGLLATCRTAGALACVLEMHCCQNLREVGGERERESDSALQLNRRCVCV